MKRLALLASLVVIVGLVLRWGCVDTSFGRSLGPSPDAPEYLALANDLASAGTVKLHLGEHELASRYPPGWPIMLSFAIRCGIQGEDMVYLSGPIACLLALLMAGITLLIWNRACDPGHHARSLGLAAAAIAGIGWVTSPLSIDQSGTVMCDEMAALLANAALLLLALGMLPKRASRAWLFLGGLCFAACFAIRTPNLFLGAGPIACLLLAAVVRHGIRDAALRAAFVAIGIAPVVWYVCSVLAASGFDPWQWSNYEFWHRAGNQHDFASDFDLEFALHGLASTTFAPQQQTGHLELALRFFGGLCFDTSTWRHASLGYLWPLLAWPTGACLWLAIYRREGSSRPVCVFGGVALLGWIAGHIVAYSLYVFPGARFYTACLPWAWVCVGLGFAWLWRHGTHRKFLCVLLAAVFVGACLPLRTALRSNPPGPMPVNTEQVRNFESWLQLSDDERESRVMPFDPLRIQALGLLTPQTLQRIGEWGRLPSNLSTLGHLVGEHRRQVIPDMDEKLPKVVARLGNPLRVPKAATYVGEPALWFDAQAQVYRLQCRDFAGTIVADFRISVATKDRRLEVAAHGSALFVLNPFGTGAAPISHRLNAYRQAIIVDTAGCRVICRLVGKSLEIQTLGTALPSPTRVRPRDGERTITVPGFPDAPVRRDPDGWFYSTLTSPLADGEVLYAVMDRRLVACLPIVDRVDSPFRVRDSRPAMLRSQASRIGDLEEQLEVDGLFDVALVSTNSAITESEVFAVIGPAGPIELRATETEMMIPGPALSLLNPKIAYSYAPRPPAKSEGADRSIQRNEYLATTLVFGRRLFLDSDDLPGATRDHHLLVGALRAMASSRVTQVSYFDAKGGEHDIESALSKGLDLEAPRLRITYGPDLTVRVNLSREDWRVNHRGAELSLPRFGFAVESEAGVRTLRARHPQSGEIFEFAANPGRSRMLHGCGHPCEFAGMAVTGGGLRLEQTRLIGAAGLRIASGGIEHDSAGELNLGRNAWQLRALIDIDNGVSKQTYDVTRRAKWTSSDPSHIEVDPSGVVIGRGLGTAVIRAEYDSMHVEYTMRAAATARVSPIEAVHLGESTMVLSFSADVWLRDGIVAQGAQPGLTTDFFADTTPLRHRRTVRLHNILSGAVYSLQAVGEMRSGQLVFGDSRQLATKRRD